jgi:hypothetical protein
VAGYAGRGTLLPCSTLVLPEQLRYTLRTKRFTGKLIPLLLGVTVFGLVSLGHAMPIVRAHAKTATTVVLVVGAQRPPGFLPSIVTAQVGDTVDFENQV